MEIKAWHANNEYFAEVTSFIFSKDRPSFALNDTHVELPVSTSVEGDSVYLLEKAFEFFNFCVSDHITINTINDFAANNNTHTSMSIGDIVEFVETKEFWICECIGWTKLDNKRIGV